MGLETNPIDQNQVGLVLLVILLKQHQVPHIAVELEEVLHMMEVMVISVKVVQVL